VRDVEAQAALLSAWTGGEGGARRLAADLGKQFPQDTLVNSYWLPTVEAQVMLTNGNAAEVLDRLRALSYPLELGERGSADFAVFEVCPLGPSARES
jgi:hypothetical protein